MCIFQQQLIVLLVSSFLFGYLVSQHIGHHYYATALHLFLLFIHLPLCASPSSISLQPNFPCRHFAFCFCQSSLPFLPGASSIFLSLHFSLSLLIFFYHPLPIFLFPYQIPSLSILHTRSASHTSSSNHLSDCECMRGDGAACLTAAPVGVHVCSGV